MNIKKVISFCLFLAFVLSTTTQLFAQKDTVKRSDSIKINFFSDSRNNFKDFSVNLLDTTSRSSIFNFRPTSTVFNFKSEVNKYFNPSNENKKRPINFMANTNTMDSDILVKKHFNGKDMSNVKLTSHFSLGTLHSATSSVRIEVRDHSLVDGDRIKVYLNEQLLNSNIMLNGLYYIINIDLRSGYNRIDIEAINEGYSGPNTAEIRIFDEKGYLMTSREWNILTGQRATLGVVKNK